MLHRLLDRMVQRALPRDFSNPEDERIAVDAAECGIRYTARVIGIPALVLLVSITALFSLWIMFRPAPLPIAVSGSQALKTENEQLRAGYRSIQKERDGLIARVAELEAETQDAALRPEPPRTDASPLPKTPVPPSTTSSAASRSGGCRCAATAEYRKGSRTSAAPAVSHHNAAPARVRLNAQHQAPKPLFPPPSVSKSAPKIQPLAPDPPTNK